MLSWTGSWIEAAAFGYVVLLLGGSAATLGLIGFLNTIPNLVLALPAGALADRFDRRKVLFVFQGANMGVAIALALLWATGELNVFLMGVLAFLGGSFGTLSFPAFQAMLASTVPEEDLESAVALNSLSLQLARFVGPAIAGVLLARRARPGCSASTPRASSPCSSCSRSSGLTAASSSAAAARRRDHGRAALRLRPPQHGLAHAPADPGRPFRDPPVAFMIPGLVRFQLDAGAGRSGF